MQSMLFLLSILMVLFQPNQCQIGMPGGWSAVPTAGLPRVQQFCETGQQDIVNLMLLDGHSVSKYCKQVVVGMNFKADIEICEFKATVQFFVPLPINGVAQNPQDFQLLDVNVGEVLPR